MDERVKDGMPPLLKRSLDPNIPVFMRVDILRSANPDQELITVEWMKNFYKKVMGAESEPMEGEKTEIINIDGRQGVLTSAI